MAQVADQLAVAVGTQWTAEAAMRRLNDPYPLPVSWAAADASLTDSWDSLVKLATSGAGWPPPPKRPWARGLAGLAPVFAHGISLDEPAGSADVDAEEVE